MSSRQMMNEDESNPPQHIHQGMRLAPSIASQSTCSSTVSSNSSGDGSFTNAPQHPTGSNSVGTGSYGQAGNARAPSAPKPPLLSSPRIMNLDAFAAVDPLHTHANMSALNMATTTTTNWNTLQNSSDSSAAATVYHTFSTDAVQNIRSPQTQLFGPIAPSATDVSKTAPTAAQPPIAPAIQQPPVNGHPMIFVSPGPLAYTGQLPAGVHTTLAAPPGQRTILMAPGTLLPSQNAQIFPSSTTLQTQGNTTLITGVPGAAPGPPLAALTKPMPITMGSIASASNAPVATLQTNTDSVSPTPSLIGMKRRAPGTTMIPTNVGSGDTTLSSVNNNPIVVSLAGSSVSKSCATLQDGMHITKKSKREIDEMAPEDKRRFDRNLREQQRSYKISQQIKELRTVLTESNIPFKPNKFSILQGVVEYIKQLQGRAIFLDSEHRKLVTTIQQTNEMLNSEGDRTDSTGTTKTLVGQLSHHDTPNVGNDADLLFVQGIDYKFVFAQCLAGLGVAALDGRFLDCNQEFERISGYSKADLLRISMFSLFAKDNMEQVFKVMGKMLRTSGNSEGGAQQEGSVIQNEEVGEIPKYWIGSVPQKGGKMQLRMSIMLTKSIDGNPKFFNCSLSYPP